MSLAQNKTLGFIKVLGQCVLEVGRGLLRGFGIYAKAPIAVKHTLPNGMVVGCAIKDRPIHRAFMRRPEYTLESHEVKFLGHLMKSFENRDANSLAGAHGLIRDDKGYYSPYTWSEDGTVVYRETGQPVPEENIILGSKYNLQKSAGICAVTSAI